MFRRALISMVAAAGVAATAAAAITPKISYQGYLREGGGLAVGNKTMVFRLYPSSTSTTVLWTSPSLNVAVSTGLFHTTLEPAGVDWEANNVWIELEVNGTRLSPREELTTAPYAINALYHGGKKYTNAGTAPASPSSGDLWFDTSAGALKFWTGTAWATTSGAGLPGAHAATHAGGGADPVTSLGALSLTGDATFNAGTRLSSLGDGVRVSTHLLVTAGSLGVGTASPGTKLDVAGDARFGSTTRSTFTSAGALNLAPNQSITLQGGTVTGLADPTADTDAAPRKWVLDNAGSSGGGWTRTGTAIAPTNIGDTVTVGSTFTVQGNAFSVGGSTLVASAGRLGVGTASPARTLHVVGDEVLLEKSGGMQLRLNDTAAGAATQNIVFERGGSLQSTIFNNAANELTFQTNNLPLRFKTSAADERVRISAAGLVGIGTSGPQTLLDVNGDAQFGATAKSTFTSAGALNMASGQHISLAGGGKVTGLADPTADTDAAPRKWVLDSAGSSGGGWTRTGTAIAPTNIGDTVTVGSTFTVQGNAFSVGGSTIAVTDGRVGVGTASPGALLEISKGGLGFLRLGEGDGNGRSLLTTNAGGGLSLQATGPGSHIMLAPAANVGVGVALNRIPAAKLDVEGDAQFGSTAKSTFTSAGALNMASGQHISLAGGGKVTGLADPTADTDAAPRKWVLDSAGASGGGWTRTGTAIAPTNIGDTVTVGSTFTVQGNAFSVGGSTIAVTGGNVGVGTGSPGNSLTLRRPGPNAWVLAVRNSADSADTFRVSSEGKVELGAGDAGAPGLRFLDDADAGLFHPGSDTLAFTTAGSERLRISPLGRVGIGTMDPAARLHMSSGTLWVDGDAATALKVGQSTFVVNANGNVGIGTSSPAQRLAVNGMVTAAIDQGFSLNGDADTNWRLYFTGGNDIYLTGVGSGDPGRQFIIRDVGTGNDRFNFALTGEFGIGTPAPVAKLDVNGNAQFGSTAKSTFTSAGALNMASGQHISLAGGGKVTGLADPTADTDAAPRKWVLDSAGASGGGWTRTGTAIAPTNIGDTVTVGSTFTVQGNAFSVGGSTFSVANGRVTMGAGDTLTGTRLSVTGISSSIPLLNLGDPSEAFSWKFYRLADNILQTGLGNQWNIDGAPVVVGGPHSTVDADTNDKLVLYTGAVNGAGASLLKFKTTGDFGANFAIDTASSGNLFIQTRDAGGGAAYTTRMAFDRTNGRVGVGTTSPYSTMTVAGAVGLSGIAQPSGAAAGRGILYFDSAANRFKVSENGGGYVDLVNQASAGGWTRTGTAIAPTNPGDTVTVNSTFTVQGNAFSVGDSTFNVKEGGIGMGGAATSSYRLFVKGPTTAGSGNGPALLTNSDASQILLTSRDDGRLATGGDPLPLTRFTARGQTSDSTQWAARFANSSAADLLAVRNDGNVGVGSASPSVRLHVGSSGEENTLALQSGSGTTQLIKRHSTNDLDVVHAGLARMQFLASGNVAVPNGSLGVNQAAPQGKLHVSSGSVYIDGDSGGFRVGPSTFVVKADGNVGVGTAAPAALLSVMGDNAVGQLYVADSAGNQLLRLTDQGNYGRLRGSLGAFIDLSDIPYVNGLWSYGNATLDANVNMATADPAKKVGIGTYNPAARLHLSSGTLLVDGDASTALQVGQSTFVVKGSGYAGVGTASPEGRLDVQAGSLGAPPLQVQRTYDGGRIRLKYGAATDGYGEIGQTYFGAGQTNIWMGSNLNSFGAAHEPPTQGSAAGASWLSRWSSISDNWSVQRIAPGGGTTASTLMLIDSAGKVGIGTTSPGVHLDVLGAARIQNQGAATNASTGKGMEIQYVTSGRAQGEGAYLIAFDRSATQYKQFVVDAGSITLAIGGGIKFHVNEGGNVGIGTTSPSTKLHVVGSGVEPVYFTTSGSDGALSILSLYGSGGADREFYFNNAGNAAADGTWSGPADYAEYFYSDDTTLKPGELICIAGENKVERCRPGRVLIGVVSTKPGILGIYADDVTDASEEYAKDPHWVKVALMGQVPTKISVSQGSVKAGDQLTVGTGGRAVAGASPRTLLLLALEDAEADGLIRVLVK